MKSRLVRLFAALRPKPLVLLALALLAPARPHAVGQTYYDNLITGSGSWTTAAYWNTLPVSGIDTSITFGSVVASNVAQTVTNNSLSPFVLNSLNFVGTSGSTSLMSYIIQGGSLDFRNGSGGAAPRINLDANLVSKPARFSLYSDIVATDRLTFAGNGSALFTVAGVISGTNGIVKSGSSYLTLLGNNTYTGGTTLSGGTLQIGNGSTTGSITGDVLNNGTLIFNRSNASALSGNITGNGTTNIAAGTLTVGDGVTSGAITTPTLIVNGALILNRAGDFTQGGTLSGAGSFTKLGTGMMTLTDAQPFTGRMAISAGGLTLAYASALSTSTLQMDAGTSLLFGDYTALMLGGLQGAANIDFINSSGGGIALTFSGTNTTASYTGSLTGVSSITKLGSGTTTLAGANNFQGPVTITAGTLGIGHASSLGDASNTVSVGSGGTLMTSAAITIPQTIAFADNATVNTNGFNSTYTVGLGNRSTTFNKTGAGTFSLGGDNLITGNVNVTAGALGVAPGATLRLGDGGTTGTISGGVEANGAFVIDHSGTESQTISLSGTGTFNKLGTGTLTLAGNHNFAGTTNFTGNLTLANLDLGSTPSFSTISGNITGAGTVTKSGVGYLTLAGNNSYAGGTVVSSGSVIAGSATAFGPGRITFTQSTAQLLGTNGIYTIANPITLNGPIGVGAGLTLSGPITLAANAGVSANANASLGVAGQHVVLSGDISGPYAFTIDVGSTGAEVTMTGHNTYTGGTKISSVQVNIYDDSAFGAASAPLNLYNATIKALAPLTINRDIRMTGYGMLHFDTNGFTSTLSGAVPTNFELYATGGGRLNYTGSSTFYIPAIDSGTTLTLSGGGVFGGTSTFVPVVNNGMLIVDSALAAANGTVINGTGSLKKMGAGVLTLGSTNIFSGGTTITAGSVAFSTAANFGTGPITLNGGQLTWLAGSTADISSRLTIGDAGGTLSFNSPAVTFASAFTGTGPLTVNTSGTLTLSGSNTLASLNIANGSVILNSSSPMQIGVLSGAASSSLVLSGSSALTLTNPSTYAGNVSLTGGTLVVGGESVLGTKPLSLNGSALQSGGGAHTLSNPVSLAADTTISGSQSLTLAGSLTLTGFKTLNITNTARTTISGAIGEISPSILIKQGAGELQLTGANTYTGGTFISAGTVRINNTTGSAFGIGAITVAAGATLAGSGSFSGALQLNGTFSPGNSPGLTSTGAQTWAGGAGYIWEANNAAGRAGANTDLLSISGSLAINATHLNPFTVSLVSLLSDNSPGAVFNFNSANNYTYTIATATGGIAGFSSDAFTINSLGFANNLNGGAWSLSQVGNSLNLNYATGFSGPTTSVFTSGLSLSAGRTLDFRLGATSDLLDVTSGGDLTGPFSGTITINVSDSGGFGAGTYDLIHYITLADGSATAANFTLGTSPAGYTYQFILGTAALQLIATPVPEPATIALLLALAALALAAYRKHVAG